MRNQINEEIKLEIEDLKAFFETDEGKVILDGYKQPLIDKRDELLASTALNKERILELETAQEKREREAAQVVSDAEKEKLKTNGDFDAYKLFHEDEINKYSQENANLKSQYAGTEVARMIAETASKHSTSPKPLQLLLKERVSAEYGEDGKLAINVKGEDGGPMYFEGQPASIEHLVSTLKSNEEYGSFFNASGASGSGTQSTDSQPDTNGFKDMNSEDFNLTKASGNKL